MNKKINVYDFDETICFKDSTIGFWKFCIKKKPIILICIPLQLLALILVKLHITNHISLFYTFLPFFKGDTSIIKEYCDIQEKNICEWYLKQKKEDDVIVSASPSFLIEELCKRLNVKCVASDVDFKTGRYRKPSCKGKQKVIQFREKYPDIMVENSYGNAKSDRYIIAIAKNGYMVNNHSIKATTITQVQKSEIFS